MKNLTASAWSHCHRAMWLRFRDAFKIEIKPERKLAMAAGRKLEDVVIDYLLDSKAVDAIYDEQELLVGEFAQPLARIDGVAVISGKRQLLEIKAVNSKTFKRLMKEGLPDYYMSQVQIEMHCMDQIIDNEKITETLYCILNRDTMELETLTIEYNEQLARLRYDEIHHVIESEDVPPAEDDWRCNMCEYRDFCRFGDIPEIHCKTCANASVVNGNFECSFGNESCGWHLIHPAFMVSLGCEILSASSESLSIDYGDFVHGPEGYKHPIKDTYTSLEYKALFEEAKDNESN